MFKKLSRLQFVSSAPRREVAVHMAPLIDIVFLLICFYLLVAQLITNQKDPSVLLPTMVSQVADPERPAELVINLRSDGQISIGGQVVDLPTLQSVVAEQVAGARQAETPLRVAIRADRDQTFGRLDEVLKRCRRAGTQQVVFRTLREEQP